MSCSRHASRSTSSERRAETTPSNSHATRRVVIGSQHRRFRRVDTRTMSRDVNDEPPIVKAIGRGDHIDPKLCRR
jgi:hypothetical protein